MTELVSPKAPAEVLDYVFGADVPLKTVEKIATANITVSGATLNSQSIASDGKTVTAWISGGVAGQIITITALFTTDNVPARTFQRLVVIPYGEPVSLGVIKQHLRLEQAYVDEDELLALFITAARRACENYLNRSILGRQRTAVFKGFPFYSYLPGSPMPDRNQLQLDLYGGYVTSVDSVSYVDGTQTVVAVPVANFRVNNRYTPAKLGPVQAWPFSYNFPDAVTVAYTVAPIPYDDLECVSQAIRMMVATWYRNRESVAVDMRGVPIDLPQSIYWLLDPLRVIPFR